jgi:hypothetical protein
LHPLKILEKAKLKESVGRRIELAELFSSEVNANIRKHSGKVGKVSILIPTTRQRPVGEALSL